MAYRNHWSNCCNHRTGRFALWFVKWFLYIGCTWVLIDLIIGSFTGKYPLNH